SILCSQYLPLLVVFSFLLFIRWYSCGSAYGGAAQLFRRSFLLPSSSLLRLSFLTGARPSMAPIHIRPDVRTAGFNVCWGLA
ncbi:hypothetical protein DFP72DRAFT_922947, partial [Ephemerocybe angulata]